MNPNLLSGLDQPSVAPRAVRSRATAALLIAPLVALCALFFVAPTLHAAEIPVTASCTITEAITAANTDTAFGGCATGSGDDTVVLTPTVYSLSVADNSFGFQGGNGLPAITSTVTISGNGATIARALTYSCPGGSDPDFRPIFVSAPGNLTLHDVTLRNGCATTYGGALFNDSGTVTVQASAIVSNTANLGGGGLYTAIGIVTVHGSAVYSNTAGSIGGGILVGGPAAVVTITAQSKVYANGASFGGALYNVGGTVTVQGGSGIYANRAVNHGAGLYNEGGVVTIEGSAVYSNTVGTLGGGLYNLGGTVSIQESAVYSNTVSDIFGGFGGGLVNVGGLVSVQGSAVYSNSAPGGGGLYNEGPSAVLSVTAQSNVYANRANNGGGLHNIYGTVSLNDSAVYSNTAGVSGGGLYNLFGSVTLQAGDIYSNTANANGGGLYTFGTITITAQSNVHANRANNGGALYQQSGGSSITDSCIVGNSDTAVFYGSGTAPILATQNWWGAASGPSGAGPGSGDSISSNVDFSAFETAPIPGCATLEPDLTLAKTATPSGTVMPGQTITYTLVFSNVGPDTARNVVLTDTLPAQMQVSGVSANVTINQIGAAPTLVWQVSDLASGAGGTITLVTVVSDTLAADVTLTNTAVIVAGGETDLSDNSASAAHLVQLPRVHFSSAAYSAFEDSGTATITVTLDTANPYADATMEYSTADDTATAGDDYAAASDTLTIPAGQSSAVISVTLTVDAIPEPDESVDLALNAPTGAALGSPSVAVLTILDDDESEEGPPLYLPFISTTP